MNTPNIPGAQAIEEWWGKWIAFHDFYLLTGPEPGATTGALRIHGWVTDWNSTDEHGYFQRSHDCVVTMQLSGVRSSELSPSELPAIIGALVIERSGDSWVIRWDSSFGRMESSRWTKSPFHCSPASYPAKKSLANQTRLAACT